MSMKNRHNLSKITTISEAIRANKESKYKDILPMVQEIAELAGMICYFGWNTYYHEWQWGYMASKPKAAYLNYIGGGHKVYPDGTVKMKLGGKWERI